ncbi:putative spermidine/putrescine transport system ATP-binding protein [Rhizobium aethiopicum]|uniref:ABC transporter ATP-binding protein n=1 Tax=Rhizobium aethiopicum TaxID=1138170 RepID=UPI001610CD3B|nr:ABC transporter ATP-binding protein [Rhizobium aethiopicum]MBB4581620.1 putative spermidine/putrescine transport system ATP-binding protein [Rhizobium aethiopicum]
MSYLILNKLQKSFGTVVAVEGIDLAVEKGEFISLLGPSGCGKTTTLQMIAGFVEPTGGAITLQDTDLVRLPPNRRGLGIVFQSYALFPHMTVAQNLAFGLEMRGVGRNEIAELVREMLNLVGLSDKAGRYPRQMSGGQQQRVALGRALIIRPSILLLDEPLSNLDAKMREEMQIELRQIQQTLGTTTILVTHDQHEALALSDRIVVMSAAKVEQIGSPVDVYEKPATPFVASFLGRTNIFMGEVKDRILNIGGHKVPFDHPVEGRISISVRPEKLRVANASSTGLAGRVMTRVFQGDHWLFEVHTPAGPAVVISQNSGTAVPAVNENICLAMKPDDVVLLPATGGAR